MHRDRDGILISIHDIRKLAPRFSRILAGNARAKTDSPLLLSPSIYLSVAFAAVKMQIAENFRVSKVLILQRAARRALLFSYARTRRDGRR